MSDNQDKSLDILGLKPYGEAVNAATKAAVEGASAFLSRVCLPASEELGLLLKDKVINWRQRNALKITEKFEKKFNALPNNENLHAHPRIAITGLERGSWNDSDEIQEMWAGLLTSSCTKDGRDDSNLIFINLLDQLTSLEARILNLACERSKKFISENGLIYAEPLYIEFDDLVTMCGVNDIHRLDRDLDHLRAIELLDSGFPLGREFIEPVDAFNNALESEAFSLEVDKPAEVKAFPAARVTPYPLGLYFYVRCQGSFLSPIEYFGVSKNEVTGKL